MRRRVVGGQEMEFGLLGPLEIVADGQEVVLSRPRLRTLLAVLLVHRREVLGTDRAIDAVWAGHPPTQALPILHNLVSALRKALGAEMVETLPAGYRLRIGEDAVDADRFAAMTTQAERHAAGGRPSAAAALLEQALGLWRGPALVEFADAAFARGAASRLEEQRRATEDRRAELALAAGRHAEEIGPLEALVEAEPLRERRWALLLLALYRGGRQAEALATYQRLRRSLAEGLGLEPGRELQELHTAILNQDPALDLDRAAAPAGTTWQLPAPLDAFVGRETELETLTRLLDTARLMTVLGPAGAGKTRLALVAAERCRDRFADGAAFVDLAAIDDSALVPGSIASALGLEGDGTAASVHAGLSGRELLLVLDNLEHLIDAGPLVTGLLAACPEVRVLATSQRPLQVTGEHRVILGGLADDDAVALFAARAAAVRPGFAVSSDDRPVVAAICAQLDGLPLAIELAAARSHAFPPRELLTRLEPRLSVLGDGPRDAPARHRTLAAAVGWSTALLDPPARRLLSALAVFAGGAAPTPLTAVSDDAEQLPVLLERSLATRTADERVTLLAVVREHALGLLDETARRRLQDRHAHHFLAVAEAGKPAGGETDSRRLPALDAEVDNIRAALGHLHSTGDVAAAGRLASALYRWWHATGRHPEGRAWAEHLLADAAALEPATAAELHTAAGYFAGMAGDHAAGMAHFRAGAEGWAALGAPAGEARCRLGLAQMTFREGLWDDAAAAELTRASRLAAQTVDELLVIRVSSQAAMTAEAHGDRGTALARYQEVLAIARRTGRAGEVATGAANVAGILAATGDHDGAEAAAQEAMTAAHAAGAKPALALAFALAGLAALERGDAAAASWRYGEALAATREANLLAWSLDCICGLASAAYLDGNLDEAAFLFAVADARYAAEGLVPEPGVERDCFDRHRTAVRAALTPERLAAARHRAKQLSTDDAIRLGPQPARWSVEPAGHAGQEGLPDWPR